MRLFFSLSILTLGCGVNVAAPWTTADANFGARLDGGTEHMDAHTQPSDARSPAPNRDSGTGQSTPDSGAPARPDAGRPGVDDDHGNWVTTGTTIPLNGTTPGRINYPMDQDFFVFTTTSEGIYTVFTRGSIDTFCVIHTLTGRPLFEDDNGGSERNCQITERLEASSAYALGVRHFDPRARGPYTVHVEGPIGGFNGPRCGDGHVDAGEQCDDGNTDNADGCSSRCQREGVGNATPEGCVPVVGRQRRTVYCWQPRPWAQAQAHCQSTAMDLVSIDNETDNRILWSNTPFVERWLGLNDRTEENVWAWVGRGTAYRNWNNGEPNDFGAGEDCAQLTGDGRWNDRACATPLSFFCENPN